jgi:GWxTD domain-containing protein
MDLSTFVSDSIFFSGLEFATSITPATSADKKKYPDLIKNGLLVVPYVSDFFPSSVKSLSYYLEIYNTDKILKNEPFLLKVYLENAESLEILPKYVYYFRKQSAPALVAASKIDIETLPSGKYNLVFEVRDKKNNLKYQKRFLFGRSNPKIDRQLLDTLPDVKIDTTFVAEIPGDSLLEYIKYLYPISNPMELSFAKTQLKAGDVKMMRNYFYVFWLRRNSKDPGKEWKKYLAQVKYVNENFSTQIKKGYETDRGRVYLQYGSPDDVITEEHDPGLVPYQIWYYYHLKGQNNAKFVFYNPDLNYNGYVLLHSTAKGEVYLPNWKAYLDKRSNIMYDPYNNNIGKYVGGHLDRDIMQDDIDRQH